MRISVSNDGTEGNGGSFSPDISADGQTVVFDSVATNLGAGDATDGILVRHGSEILRADVSTGGEPSNGYSSEPVVSGDGRYVAFRSQATNLVAQDTNGVTDIFVRDLHTLTTRRVNLSSTGQQAVGEEDSPGAPDTGNRLAISGDGRYVTFGSRAANLVPGDTNGHQDVFVRDLTAETTTRASVGSQGQQALSENRSASISADGRYVAFGSFAANLVAGDTNRRPDVFVRDLVARTTVRVNLSTRGDQAASDPGTWSGLPSISGDGRSVAFVSTADNLGGLDSASAGERVYVRDLAAGTTTLAATQSRDTGRLYPGIPHISDDGRYVTVESDGSAEMSRGLFVRDMAVRGLTKVSVPYADGQEPSWWSVTAAAISADGSQVVFSSDHDQLVPNDTNEADDVFLHTLGRR
ncbi:TolB family protein [Streptomyces sp. NPDC002580]|uniref:TolB family protein n=1 Tax=Streptomyces sp. NPDC002580 TaxID=3364653 RepID=UPI0036B07A1E